LVKQSILGGDAHRPMIEIAHFTDPACPFAFSAEAVRTRLLWEYGEGLRWRTRMIVLSREEGEGEKLAGGAPGLQRKYGMPIDPVGHARAFSTEPACLAFVAARLHAPERAEALLRALRVRIMLGELPDEPAMLDAAARDVGLDPEELREWAEREDVRSALEADAAAARSPAPAALALDHKLSGPAGERRYSAPSYELRRVGSGGEAEDGCTVAIPGFHRAETYEAAIANLDPGLRPRSAPGSLRELLEWAPFPLATAEVVSVTGLDEAQARAGLAAAAEPIPAGADFYWRLPG
jgi:predicted DsbA family dithiol-disulfide isomerase